MKKKIFGVLIALVLAVTGFGLVGCGGNKQTPAPGPGPEPAPEVSYDDDTTPVPIDETGLLLQLVPCGDVYVDDIEWYGLQEDEGMAFVWGVTQEVTDLVIPAYVTDGEEVYKVVEIDDLVMEVDPENNYSWTGNASEYAAGIETITIPSTVIYVDGFAAWYDYQDPANNDVWLTDYYYLENLEAIILNNRTEAIYYLNGTFWNICDTIIELTYPDGDATDEDMRAIDEEVLQKLLNYDEENDLYYLGNPGNPYMYLFVAGNSYFPEEDLGDGEELVANVNEDCVVIGEGAFIGSPLTEINVPSTLKTIGNWAFGECNYLTNMVITSNMTSWSDVNNVYNSWDNFEKCEILDRETIIEGFMLPDPWEEENKVYYNIDPNGDEHCYYVGNEDNPYLYLVAYVNNDEITENLEVTINANCKVIGEDAFAGAPITSINLPNRLTAIGYDAFAECTNLSTLVISETVKYLGTDIVLHGDNTDTYIKSAYVLKYLDNFGSDFFYVLVSIMDESDVEFENYFQAEDTVTFGGEEYFRFYYGTELELP